MRNKVPTVLSAMALGVAILGASTSAIAHGVEHALFAHNAGKLQGRHANQLVRASNQTFTFGVPNFTSTDFDSLTNKEVEAPTRGILLVWGAIATSAIDAEPPAVLNARIRMRGRATTTQTLYLGDSGGEAGSISISGAIPVGKGKRTVRLEAYLSDGTGVSITSTSLTTLFVPFGNNGEVGVLRPL